MCGHKIKLGLGPRSRQESRRGKWQQRGQKGLESDSCPFSWEASLQVQPVLFPAGQALVFSLFWWDGPPESLEMTADLIRPSLSQRHSISEAERAAPAPAFITCESRVLEVFQ